MPEIARLSSGQQQPAQYRPEGLRRRRSARRLAAIISAAASACWGSDPPLLDREVGDVAGREHIRKTVHLTVRIDREESVDRLRQAIDPRPAQPW